jgi:hypothetical protein
VGVRLHPSAGALRDRDLGLRAEETCLTGNWRGAIGGETDEVDARIFHLVREMLEHVASAAEGWDQLFRDPADGRFWELTFPHGSLYGGGPRQLTVIDPARVAAKYGVRVE